MNKKTVNVVTEFMGTHSRITEGDLVVLEESVSKAIGKPLGQSTFDAIRNRGGVNQTGRTILRGDLSPCAGEYEPGGGVAHHRARGRPLE